jgi:hypothetical protein
MDEPVAVRPVEPPGSSADLGDDDELVVLPRDVTPEGIGQYDDSVITTVKELQAAGIQSRFQHDASHREWIGEEAFGAEAIALVVAIGGAGAWDGLKYLLRHRDPKSKAKVKFGRRKVTERTTERTTDRVTEMSDEWEWFEAEGDADAVADALDHFDSERQGSDQGVDGEEDEVASTTPDAD